MERLHDFFLDVEASQTVLPELPHQRRLEQTLLGTGGGWGPGGDASFAWLSR